MKPTKLPTSSIETIIKRIRDLVDEIVKYENILAKGQGLGVELSLDPIEQVLTVEEEIDEVGTKKKTNITIKDDMPFFSESKKYSTVTVIMVIKSNTPSMKRGMAKITYQYDGYKGHSIIYTTAADKNHTWGVGEFHVAATHFDVVFSQAKKQIDKYTNNFLIDKAKTKSDKTACWSEANSLIESGKIIKDVCEELYKSYNRNLVNEIVVGIIGNHAVEL